MDDDALLAAIAEIHAAAGDPARWRALVERLAAERGSLDEELRRHLHVAGMAHREAVDLTRKYGVMAGVHDTLAAGIVIVDPAGRIHRANRAADRLLAQGHGLARAGGRLHVADPDTSHRLARLLAHAAADQEGAPQHFADAVLAISRPGRRPLSLLVVGLLGPASAWRIREREPPVVLLILDPDVPPGTTQAMLRDLFGLTPRESDLAQLLLEGHSPAQAARSLGVTSNTVRTLLKRVTAKTGTHGQADLVHRLLSISPLEDPPN